MSEQETEFWKKAFLIAFEQVLERAKNYPLPIDDSAVNMAARTADDALKQLRERINRAG